MPSQPIPPAAARLAERWRADAAVLRRYGAENLADLVERMAAEMEAELKAGDTEVIGLAAAEALSGYTAGHLRRLVRDGRLRNVGSDRKPEFVTADLPRKPGYLPVSDIPDPAATPSGSRYREIVDEVLRGHRRATGSRQKGRRRQ